MSQKSPRHRYETVSAACAAAETPSDDPLEAALYAVLKKEPGANDEVQYAYELFANEEHHSILDAFLLAGASFDIVSRVLGVPINVLQTYQHLFFDTQFFRNKLERISYATQYPGDAYAKELMRTGVMVGADFLIWTFGGREEIDTRQVVRHTMVDSFYRGMAHRGNSLTSGVTREAQKWWSTAIRNAEILEKMDPRSSQDAANELRIALKGTDETISVEKSPVPIEDILH